MTKTKLSDFYPVQDFFWPESADQARIEVFFRPARGQTWQTGACELVFAAGDHVSFDCAANLFNLATWQEFCGLDSLALALSGAGEFALEIVQTLPDFSQQVLVAQQVKPADTPVMADVPGDALAQGGILHFTLRALTPGRLNNACWGTRMPPRRTPQLGLVITTFRREQAVTATLARFHDFMEACDLAAHMHLWVIDNGQTLTCPDTPFMTRLPNENLGGSGGFTRGLLAAQQSGVSHCLFMDDDASIQMGALARCWRFLAYAIAPETAIAGGLLWAQNAAWVWENGALFDLMCRPIHMKTDLRLRDEVYKMEFAGDKRRRPNFYGAWWFFVFPAKGLDYLPFPFFVRGDDVSFCLANRFKIATLPGLFSRQEVDFFEKENLQTIYLDLRSHLAIHLSLPFMARGRVGCFKSAVIFYLRALVQCQYETIEAINLALEDVMRGPSFFVEHADMVQRRADLNALRQNERDGPLHAVPDKHIRINPHNIIWRLVMKFTLNGHLLPFFGYFGNHLVWNRQNPGGVRKAWGAAQIVRINDGGQGYVLRHSKKQALRGGLRFLKNGARFFWHYPRLVKQWRKGYREATRHSSWQKLLKL